MFNKKALEFVNECEKELVEVQKQLADILPPGTHSLNTDNLPLGSNIAYLTSSIEVILSCLKLINKSSKLNLSFSKLL